MRRKYLNLHHTGKIKYLLFRYYGYFQIIWVNLLLLCFKIRFLASYRHGISFFWLYIISLLNFQTPWKLAHSFVNLNKLRCILWLVMHHLTLDCFLFRYCISEHPVHRHTVLLIWRIHYVACVNLWLLIAQMR